MLARFDVVPIIAVLGIVAIEGWAIAHGINGKGVVASVGALSAVAGYYYHKARNAKKGN